MQGDVPLCDTSSTLQDPPHHNKRFLGVKTLAMFFFLYPCLKRIRASTTCLESLGGCELALKVSRRHRRRKEPSYPAEPCQVRAVRGEAPSGWRYTLETFTQVYRSQTGGSVGWWRQVVWKQKSENNVPLCRYGPVCRYGARGCGENVSH